MSVNPQQPPPPQSMPHYGGQQQQQTTTVVINQPAAGNKLIVGNVHGSREWTHGLFDCFSDFGTCMFNRNEIKFY